MNDDDLKKFRNIIKEEVSSAITEQVPSIVKQQIRSALSQQVPNIVQKIVQRELQTQVPAIVQKELAPIKVTLARHGERIDAVWEQTASLTEDMAAVQDILQHHSRTLKIHSSFLKTIDIKVSHHTDNIHKLDRRVMVTEEHLGIVPPAELTIN